ncbi:hypothetical protein WR25_11936 isoform D [Diploscapter pachys]|uniref:Uncharacterized protein n=1 Tax=Diploscapter pachys TaxID=2018661 RepID=A0A2A2LT62_9BILA|nr:hypothetical protein WR25_11936 isoform D [Diploscapter pachys]
MQIVNVTKKSRESTYPTKQFSLYAIHSCFLGFSLKQSGYSNIARKYHFRFKRFAKEVHFYFFHELLILFVFSTDSIDSAQLQSTIMSSDFLFAHNAYTKQGPYSNRLRASGFDNYSNSMHALSSAWDKQDAWMRNSQSGNYNEGGYNNSPPYNSTADRGRDRGEGNGRRAASGRGGGGGQEGYQRVERGQYAPFERRAYNHIRIGLDQHPLSSISLRETITDSSKVEQSETNSPRLDGSPGKDQMYSEQPIRNRHNESFSAGLMKANSSVDTGNNSENLVR